MILIFYSTVVSNTAKFTLRLPHGHCALYCSPEGARVFYCFLASDALDSWPCCLEVRHAAVLPDSFFCFGWCSASRCFTALKMEMFKIHSY